MAQNFALNLGSGQTGLTDLRAQWLTALDAAISTTSTGFTELSGGQYTFTATVPATAAYVRFYSNAQPSTIFFTLAVDPESTPGAATAPDTVNAYLYTRNAQGTIVPAQTVYYQQVGNDDVSGDAFDDDVQSVVSDGTGLAEIEMMVGGHYRYWIGSGRFKTAHIIASTANPYALPQVSG